MLAHGELSEAPSRRWKPGQEQHQGPENQDSQHMLDQHRGSLPDRWAKLRDPNREALAIKKRAIHGPKYSCNLNCDSERAIGDS